MPGSDVIVVGAGVAGLWCGTLLADHGLKVLVLEASAACGGRARSWLDEATGIPVDIGPHVVTSEHRNFIAMLARLRTDKQLVWQPDPLITLLDHGEKLRMPNRAWLPPLHGLPLLPNALRRLSTGDLLSHWRLGWAGARANEVTLRQLDGEPASTWLRRMGVSRRAIDWFWRSAMLALLNVALEDCSAASVMRVFRIMMGRSGYHFAFPETGLSELYVPACTGAIEGAGGEVLTNAAVSAVVSTQDGFTLTLRDGRQWHAPRCVLALAPQDLAALIERSSLEVLAGLRDRARAFEPSPYVSTMLWFDRSLTQERFWARVWSPRDLNTDFYDLSNIRPELAGKGSVIACNAIGPQLANAGSDDQIVRTTLRELADFAPAAQEAKLLHACVHRIEQAVPRPQPGTETRRPSAHTQAKGLWLAGDWTDTSVPSSMESAARSAALAAEAVLEDLGKPRTLAIPPPETGGLIGLLRKPYPPEHHARQYR